MIISIASGKGGTGKTLVTSSLAVSLKEKQHVQVADCDVEEPNAHIFLKPEFSKEEKVYITVPRVDKSKCTYCGKCADVCAFNAIAVINDKVLIFDELCHGCGACGYLCPEHAITEYEREIGSVQTGKSDGINFVRGTLNVGEAMSPPVIRKVKEKIEPSNIVLLDVPPGTSCPVVESIQGSDYCLLVTEPTPFGLNDLALAVEVVKILHLPCGVILNRAGSGNERIEDYCKSEGIPILLTIPLDTDIAKLYSRGITLAEGMPEWQERFIELFQKIQEQLL
ncbi:MAG: ATP-binding protein [Dehalococcoidia bacterium]